MEASPPKNVVNHEKIILVGGVFSNECAHWLFLVSFEKMCTEIECETIHEIKFTRNCRHK
jgi:hypothetical protein